MRSGTISRLLRRRSSTSLSAKTLSPLEIFTQLQLGIHPPVSAQKSFLMEYCKPQLERRLITEAKLIAMDSKLCEDMLRGFLYERYLAVPFRLFTFDMEFTGPPVFTSDGPTQDITEIGIYSPARECTFDTLVQPCCGRRQSAEVEKLTNIANSELDGATPFPEAWRQFLEFAHTPEPNELPGSEKRILLLSHGGKLADVSLIKWTVDKFKLPLPESFVFGDTVHLIRDAHRRRPVTIDKHPPSWSLLDLIQWLKVEPTLPAHRAGNDAKMTWDALYHTLLRYGEENMTPREQLIPRFFDEEAKKRMSADMFKNARLQETDLDTLNSINSVGFVNNAYNEITDNDNNADTTVSTTQNISSNNSYEYYNRGVERKMLNEFDEDSYAVADLPHHRQVVQESNDDNESAIFDLNFDEIFSRSEETNTEHEHQSLQEHSNKQNDELKFSEEEYEYEHTSAADAAAKATSILSKALHNEPIKLTGHVANEISHDNNGNNEIDTFNISFTDIDSNVNVEVSSISYSSENNTVSSVSSKSKTKTDTQEDAVVAAVVVVEKADKTNHALDKTKQKNNKRKMKEHVKEKGVSKTKSGKTKQKRKTEHPQEEHKVQPVVLDLESQNL